LVIYRTTQYIYKKTVKGVHFIFLPSGKDTHSVWTVWWIACWSIPSHRIKHCKKFKM